jgi:LysR family carnitine catabolism transcriptional activator
MKRKPSLATLRVFMRVAQAGSFSEAARVMNTSQPALSRTIRLLEEDLDVRLFDRDTRNMRLTASGAALLPIVERLAADFDQALLEVENAFSGMQGRVVVGALPSAAADMLPDLIVSFRQSYPLVEIVIRDHLSGALYQQMLERQVDFSLSTPPEFEKGFIYQHLFWDPCVLICRRDEAPPPAGAAPWAVFAERPFLAMSPRSSVRVMTDAAMAKAGVAPKALFECSQLATLGALISKGLGISAVPLSAIRLLNSPDVVFRSLRDPVVRRSIGLAWLEARTLPPSAVAFKKHVEMQISLKMREDDKAIS